MTYRWIVYTARDDIPGNTSFDLDRVTALAAARGILKDFSRNTGTQECSARLYPYSEEDWASALEFKDAGCPFDYPAKLLKVTEQGSVREELV